MTSFFSNLLSSHKTSIVLMLLFAIILGVATFVEKFYGTEVAKLLVYYSPMLILLQFLLVINFLAIASRYQLFSLPKVAFAITHCAFVIILCGAFVTYLFGEEGTIHLRENEQTDRIAVQTNHGHFTKKLPFTIQLNEFILTRYPGSSSPSSFESVVKIEDEKGVREENISMNNVLDIKGYRLFQASYDTDEKGTILSVNKDVAGRTITYTGYFLLVIGFILCFVTKDTRFRRLLKELKMLRTNKISLIVLLFLPLSLSAQSGQNMDFNHFVQNHAIPAEHAAKFGALPMQATSGRMKPINTFSSEILRKLHHAERIGKLNSDQFLLSLLTFPEMWMKVPFIYHRNKDIASKYNLAEGMCAYADLFDTNGFYKLQQQVEQSHAMSPASRTRFDKDIIKLDEQINIFHQLVGHGLLRLFPQKDDETHKWYASGDNLSSLSAKDSIYIANMMPQYVKSIQQSLKKGDWTKSDEIVGYIHAFQIDNNTTLNIVDQQIAAELLFNKLDVFRHCKKAYLIFGGLLLLFSFASYFQEKRYLKYTIRALAFLVGLTFLFHLLGLGLRGYIGGYAPWSNSYETMIYISLISIVGGFVFFRHSKLTFALATLFAGVIIFVSGLSWMDPQVNTLVPVLKSPWLMIHVAVIVAAYSFFGIACLLGLTNVMLLIINDKERFAMRIKELSIVNELTLLLGLALMSIGTFLGAVWANESWGRYWGWDSKETWALVTILVYAIVTHLRLVKGWDNPWLFNIVSILAFLSVLMTYFGVNYFLTGLHSYA